MSSDDQLIGDKQLFQIYDGMSKRFKHDYPATTVAKSSLPPFKHLKKSTVN